MIPTAATKKLLKELTTKQQVVEGHYVHYVVFDSADNLRIQTVRITSDIITQWTYLSSIREKSRWYEVKTLDGEAKFMELSPNLQDGEGLWIVTPDPDTSTLHNMILASKVRDKDLTYYAKHPITDIRPHVDHWSKTRVPPSEKLIKLSELAHSTVLKKVYLSHLIAVETAANVLVDKLTTLQRDKMEDPYEDEDRFADQASEILQELKIVCERMKALAGLLKGDRRRSEDKSLFLPERTILLRSAHALKTHVRDGLKQIYPDNADSDTSVGERDEMPTYQRETLLRKAIQKMVVNGQLISSYISEINTADAALTELLKSPAAKNARELKALIESSHKDIQARLNMANHILNLTTRQDRLVASIQTATDNLLRDKMSDGFDDDLAGYRQLQESLEGLQDERNALKKQIEELTCSKEEIQTELNQALASATLHQKEVAELKNTIDNIRASMASGPESPNALKLEIAQKNTEIENLQKKVAEALNETRRVIDSRNKDHEAKVLRLEKQMENLRSENKEKIASLQDDKKNLANDLITREGEIQTLHKQTDDMQTEINRFMIDKARLERELGQVKLKLASASSPPKDNSHRERELQNLKKDLSSKDDIISSLEQEKSRLTMSLQNTNRLLREAQDALRKAREKIHDLTEEVSNKKKELAEKDEVIEQSRNDVRFSEERIRQYVDSQKMLEEELSEKRSEQAELKRQLNKLDEEHAQLKVRYQTSQAEADFLTSTVTDYAKHGTPQQFHDAIQDLNRLRNRLSIFSELGSPEEIQSKITSYEDRIRTLEQKNTEAVPLTNMKNERDDCLREKAQLREELSSLQEKHRQLQVDHTNLKSTNDRLSGEIKGLEDSFNQSEERRKKEEQTCKDEKGALRKKITEKGEEIMKLKRSEAKAEADIQSLNTQIADLNQQISSLQSIAVSSEECEKEKKRLKEQVDEQKKEIEKNLVKINKLDRELENEKSKVADLQKRIIDFDDDSSTQEKLSSALDRIEELRLEIDLKETELLDAASEASELQADLSAKTQDLTEARVDIATKNQELKKKDKQIAEAESQIQDLQARIRSKDPGLYYGDNKGKKSRTEDVMMALGKAAEHIKEFSHMVMTREGVKELETSVLAHYVEKGQLSSGEQGFKDVASVISKTKTELSSYLQILDDVNLRSKVLTEYNKLEKLTESLKETRQYLSEEAGLRQLRPGIKRPDFASTLNRPVFESLVEPSHIYDWIENFKASTGPFGIELSMTGNALTKYLAGHALKTWTTNFGQSNQNVTINEQIRTLKTVYGLIPNILEAIISKHRDIDFIPATFTNKHGVSNHDVVEHQSQKHLSEADKVKSLLKHYPDALIQNQRYCSHVFDYLPQEAKTPISTKFFDPAIDQRTKFEILYDALKAVHDQAWQQCQNQNLITHDSPRKEKEPLPRKNKRVTFHTANSAPAEQKDFQRNKSVNREPVGGRHNNSNNGRQGQQDRNDPKRNFQSQPGPSRDRNFSNKPTFSQAGQTRQRQHNNRERPLEQPKFEWKDDSTPPKCPVCRKYGGDRLDNVRHRFIGGKVDPDTCPLIRSKSIQDRVSFCKANGICPKCLYHPISEKHQEKNCAFTTNSKAPIDGTKFKCREPNCTNRFSTCLQHFDENYYKFEKLRNHLKDQDIKSCYYHTTNNHAGTPGYPVSYLTQSQLTEKQRQEMIEAIKLKPSAHLFSSKNALLTSLRKRRVPFDTDGDGNPLFIFDSVVGLDGKDYTVIVDTGSTETLVAPSAIGTVFEAAILDPSDVYTEVYGLSGSQPAQRIAVSIPVKGDGHRNIMLVEGVTTLNLPVPKYPFHEGEALMMKQACARNGVKVTGVINSPQLNRPVVALIGAKNSSLNPEEKFRHVSGATLYVSKLRTTMSMKNYETYCIGGNMPFIARLQTEMSGREIREKLAKLKREYPVTPIVKDKFLPKEPDLIGFQKQCLLSVLPTPPPPSPHESESEDDDSDGEEGIPDYVPTPQDYDKFQTLLDSDWTGSEDGINMVTNVVNHCTSLDQAFCTPPEQWETMEPPEKVIQSLSVRVQPKLTNPRCRDI